MATDVYSDQPSAVSISGSKVTINKSDADPSTHPPEARDGEPTVQWDGTVDHLGPADDETVKLWRKKLACYLIYEGKWFRGARGQTFYLTSFPTSYKLYTKLKGDRKDPRRDNYLYGSTTKGCRTFRSPEEFALHLKWLAFDCPIDKKGRSACECTYCAHVPQGKISSMLRKKWSPSSVSHPTQTRRTSAASKKDKKSDEGTLIQAKDYTSLNKGEGIGVWTENSGFS